MCFKEFYTMTFTNREAYERMLKRLKKHKTHSVSGTFYIIKSYNSDIMRKTRTRKDYTFDGLVNLVEHGGERYITVQSFRFRGWINNKKYMYGLNEVIEKIGNTEDVFGKVEIELR